MNYQEFKNCIITRCAELGISDYELYYQTAESTSVSAYQQEINQFSAAVEGGICFRCIHEGKMGYASTESLSQKAAAKLVERALDNASHLEAEEPVFLNEGGRSYAKLAAPAVQIPETDVLVDTVLDTQRKLYAADPAVIDGCSTQGVAEKSEIAIFNSRGLDLQEKTTLVGLVVAAVVSNGSEMANDYQISLGNLAQMNTEELTKKAAASALAKLGGEPAPTGKYPVIFDPEAMSDLLSTFSGVFSSENARKGLSKLSGKEGEEEADKAQESARALFAGGNAAEMPTYELKESDFMDGKIDILGVLAASGLTASRSEARRAVEQGGVTVDNEKVTDIKTVYTPEAFLGDGIVVKRGKKNFKRIIM